jgi:hypothetical protein
LGSTSRLFARATFLKAVAQAEKCLRVMTGRDACPTFYGIRQRSGVLPTPPLPVGCIRLFEHFFCDFFVQIIFGALLQMSAGTALMMTVESPAEA